MSDKKPWWYPVHVNSDFFAQLREEYPESADWTDDKLNDYYNETGGKYSVTWDHIGDAYRDYEPLVDYMFKLEAELEAQHIAGLEARLDFLMLEYCPEEMTDEQKENWTKCQVPASAKCNDGN